MVHDITRCSRLFLVLAVLPLVTWGHGIRAQIPLPFLVSLNTTREVASRYSSVWDIQKKGSRRLDDSELVELKVVVSHEEELAVLDDLQKSGILSFQQEKESQRKLEGINSLLSCYRTVDETYASMDELATQYSQFVTVAVVGESWLKQEGQGGHDIKVMVITSPSNMTDKDHMVVVGGHHSRELPPPEATMRWAQHLLENYGSNADITWILDRTKIHVIPIANPDGREIVQDHLDWMYRKNARASGCSRVVSDGVDLNRNYPMWWGRASGSSSNPCASDYRGTGGLSEPESLSVYLYASRLFSADMKKGSAAQAEAKAGEACPTDARGIFIDVHSAGDFVYFPWGSKDVKSPNHLSLLTMAAKLAQPGQYTLWGPGQDGFLYFVAGDATDATYGIDCVASYGYEIGSDFYASCTELETSIAPILTQSLLYAAKSVSAPYKIPLGPDVLNIEMDASDPSNTVLTVAVSDDALIVSSAKFDTPKSQPIASVMVFLDVHPYDNNASGLTMSPRDGMFDSADEFATLTLDTTGAQVLYFQATDTEGNEGPVSAIFADGRGGVDDWTSPPSSPSPGSTSSCFSILLGLLTEWFN